MIISLFIFACKEQSQNMPEKITLAYPPVIFHSLPYIASAKGFFAAEGLDVTLQTHETGKATLDSLLAGKADLATSAETPFMFAVINGRKPCMVAVIGSSGKNIAIVAKKDRGIASPSDLKGKKIGLFLGTSPEFFTDLFLSVRGISRTDVTFINLKPDDTIDALINDRVDAVTAWHPFLLQLQRKLGNNGVVFYDKDIYSDLTCLSTSPEFARQHPETLKKVLRALIRAKNFVKQNPDESKILAAACAKTDIAMVNEIWDDFDFRIALEQSLIVGLEDQTRWAIRSRLTDKTDIPNYYDFIYADALKSVKPEAVSIMR
jgi:NitT/TauT family transport system substrate-binding protein